MRTHVLVQNVGTIGTPATFANPDVVTDGIIAAFNAATGAGIDMSGANTADFILCLGDNDRPVLTAPIKPSTMLKQKLAYTVPVKQSNAIPIPAGPSAGGYYNVKVRVLRALTGTERTVDGSEPYPTNNFEVAVGASEAVESIINKFMPLINRTDVQYPYQARSNKITTVTLTGSSGTANITIDGTAYTATFASTLTVSAANFVTAHGSTILATHGITVTSSSAGIIFTQTLGNTVTPSDAVNATGDLAGSAVATQAATQLVIDAKANRTVFYTAIDGFSATIVVTPMAEGSGWGTQVQEFEQSTRGTFGDYYEESNLLGSVDDGPEINAIAGGAYLLYVLQVPNDQEDSINRSFKYSEIILALEAGTTGDFDTFLGL